MPLHRKNAHNIRKSKLDVNQRELALQLKKTISRNFEVFNEQIEEDVDLQSERCEVMKGKYDKDKRLKEVIKHADVKKLMNKETVYVGEKIFTFS